MIPAPRRSIDIRWLGIFLALVPAACDAGPTEAAEHQDVETISILPGPVFLGALGDTTTLTATALDADRQPVQATHIQWSSSDPAIATVDSAGVVTAVGPGRTTLTAATDGVSESVVAEVDPWAALDLGVASCAIRTSGTVFCWGLGVSRPVAVEGTDDWEAITVGVLYACGLTRNGVAHCWGRNDWGELGNGSFVPSDAPSPVVGELTFTSIRASGHTCALDLAGSAYCWGEDRWGQLGISADTSLQSCDFPTGTGPCSNVPVAVDGEINFVSVGTGSRRSCGLTIDGDIYCWGIGYEGDSDVPTLFSSGLGLVSLSVGDHACAIDGEGQAYCWGYGGSGELGYGGTDSRETPTAVAGDHTFARISPASSHTCGVTTNGVGYCWGANHSGQLGDGTTDDELVPVQVSGDLRFEDVRTGSSHSCGLTPEGALYCWGQGGNGQLGDGRRTDSSMPVRVPDA